MAAHFPPSHASSSHHFHRGRGSNRGGSDARRIFKRPPPTQSLGEKKFRYYDREFETDESLEAKLEDFIIQFGKVHEEYNSTPESMVEKCRDLAKILDNKLALGKMQIHEFIKKRIIYCALILPERTAPIAALIGVLNHYNHDFVLDLVRSLKEELEKTLRKCRFNTAVQILRFLSELVNCNVLATSSLLMIYNRFITVTYENNISQARSDWYVWAVLSALPWCVEQINMDKPRALEQILSIVEGYILSKRKISYLPALRTWSKMYPLQQGNKDFLGQLWIQIQNLKQAGWKEKYLPKIYVGLRRTLNDSFQHKIELFEVPEHMPDTIYPLPRAGFQLFDHADIYKGPQLPDHDSIEKFLIEQTIAGILQTYYKDRKQCAEVLVGFAERETYFPMYHMIGEMLFSQLLSLPQPPYPITFYASLMLEINTVKPEKFPAILAQSSQMLFERLEMLHTHCIERFLNWFILILNNYQFQWRWEDWRPALDKTPDHPQHWFLIDVINRCIALSYYEKIQNILPSDFKAILPPPPEPNFKFTESSETDKPSQQAKLILQQIAMTNRAWKNSPVLTSIKERFRQAVLEINNDHEVLSDMLSQCILQAGYQTLHFSRLTIDRYFPLFKDVYTHEKEKVTCIHSVVAFWKYSPQKIVFCVTHLLYIGILDCNSILVWLFEPETRKSFVCHNYVWKIFFSTLEHFKREISRFQQELKAFREQEKSEMAEGEPVDSSNTDKIHLLCKSLQDMEHSLEDFFFVFFERCIGCLNTYIREYKVNKIEYRTPWFKCLTERLQFLIIDNTKYLKPFDEQLESLLESKDNELAVSETFNQAIALINII